jgi:hypothetical protein
MALANTHLDEYRLDYERSNMDQFENRMSTYGAFEAYKADTPNTIPGYQDLIDAYDGHRTVSVVVLKRETLTSTATRHCAVGSVQATSTYVTPSWTTIEVDFMMAPSEHKGNYIKYQNAFNHQMKTVERTFLTALDTAAYTSLEANHSTVNAADGNPYTVAADSMVVPAADNDLFFNEASAILGANDLPIDNINVVSSMRLRALVAEYINQGAGNDNNRAFQFGPYSFYQSNRVTVAAGDRDTVFLAPAGSLAFLSYVDEDSKLGSKSGDHEWSEQLLPRLGFNVGVLLTKDCADLSSLGGGASSASLKENWMFSFDYSFVTAYDSGSGIGSSIFKANFTLA